MAFHLVNGLMLLGLAGVSLPLLAHLLSRKKYDVIDWGAMQFLELGRNTRRKIQLEQLLLMLLRMGMIALIALALSRPWAQGGWLANLVSTQSRDVVLVIDGSYSMGWEGKTTTPHAAAAQWAHRLLEILQPGDTVSLLDARDHVRAVIESPTRDFRYVRDELGKLPAPSGASNMAEATARAVQILTQSTSLARDVIVLTDGQAKGWRAEDSNLWTRFDELRKQPSVQPRAWVVDVSDSTSGDRTNFSVGAITLSRELTVPDFPVRVATKVSSSGSTAPSNRRVYFEVNGQRIEDRTMQVQLPPTGEVTVEFEYRFPNVGSHIVGVSLDADNLPGDNRSDASISVAEALPVLLVDGSPNLEPVRSETFFAKAALSSAGNRTPWVKAAVTPIERWSADDLAGPEVVVLANVKRVPANLVEPLKAFVAQGGGLFVALGGETDATAWNETFLEEGSGILPAKLDAVATDTAPELKGVRVVNESLELPWMERFQAKHDGGFTEARFTQWWKLQPFEGGPREPEPATPAAVPAKGKPPEATPVITAARLDTGDALLAVRRYGRGGVALLAAPLDADWSTLPAKSDYVPFLHEVIFYLAAGKTSRNVTPGMPILLPIPDDLETKEYAFFSPQDVELKSEVTGDSRHPLARLDDTTLSGVYSYRHRGKSPPADAFGPERFVVQSDRSESDLTPLDETQRALLAQDERMKFAASLDDVKAGMLTDASRAEFWPLLMFLFLALLVGEVFMTRRLVQGGHALLDDDVIEFNGDDFSGTDQASEGSNRPQRPATAARS